VVRFPARLQRFLHSGYRVPPAVRLRPEIRNPHFPGPRPKTAHNYQETRRPHAAPEHPRPGRDYKSLSRFHHSLTITIPAAIGCRSPDAQAFPAIPQSKPKPSCALGRILTPPPERRIHPAASVPLDRLPDESGVPVGVATRLDGAAEMRPERR
jgi:hypothetical protein